MQEIKRIPLEGVHNTRDLGGYTAQGGRKIRHHALIRSGELFGLTEGDKKILLQEYGLKTVIDFRTETERREKPDPWLEGVTYVANPILEETAIGITREKETDSSVIHMVLNGMGDNEGAGTAYMEGLYANLFSSAYCKKQYAAFFNRLLAQESGAVLWHCTAGKDRAGVGTALLLSVLGVSREQIVADYMKVNEFAAESIRLTVQGIVKKTKDESLAEKLKVLFGVQESYIGTVFRLIAEGYGTVERYLEEEMGFTLEASEALKNKYLE